MSFNLQSEYDRICAHLRDQGVPAATLNEDRLECQYFDQATGNKCAVGIYIMPKHHHQALEGEGCGSTILQNALELSGVIPSEEANSDERIEWIHFFMQAQHAHDNWAAMRELSLEHPEAELEGHLKDFAKRCGAVYTTPEQRIAQHLANHAAQQPQAKPVAA